MYLWMVGGLLGRLGKCKSLNKKVLPSRYQRGSRSLAVNLAQSAAAGNVLDTKPELESGGSEEDYDIPEDVENVIGKCLSVP